MSRFPKNRFPAPSKPLPVDGGIKAQSKRGAFGERWWSKRWIAVLESLGLGARLTRGRSYARRGQVIEIAIEPSGVRARVQGSRKEPYAVKIHVEPLSVAQWRRVAETVAQTPRFAAMLLNGEIPEDIEDAFQAANCALFPISIRDVRTQCSCPDSSNPCKHVAAVYYLIGEEFDRDPFLLFAFRGLERDAILPALDVQEPREQTVRPRRVADNASAPRPQLELPPVDAWILRRAGRFPFWHGRLPLEDALSAVYAKAGESAATLLAETWPDSD